MGALRCKVLHVGKIRRPFVQAGVEHFRKKIRPHASLGLLPVKEEPLRKGVPAGEIRRREGERILREMDPGHLWIALDPDGRALDSPALAATVEEKMNRGLSRLAFLVGGPHGLDPSVLERAELRLSLSPMTFSHELTVLVLLEQIYRTLAILHHLPYPK